MEAKKKVDSHSVFIKQNGAEILVDDKHTEIDIDKDSFSIEFYNRKYNASNNEFYAARLAVFYDKTKVPEVTEGMALHSINCFKPGTGMAANFENIYPALMLNPKAHHYLYYENEQNKRISLTEENDANCRFSFQVDSLSLWYEMESMHETSMPHIYLSLLIDHNLNGIVDKGEYTFITLNINGNQKYSTLPYWNIQDENGQTPLHQLFLGNKWADLSTREKEMLLQEASEDKAVKFDIQDKWGNTPLHYAVVRQYGNMAVTDPSYDLIKFLMNQSNSGLGITNFYTKNTPFVEFITSRNHNDEMYQRILSLFLAHTGLWLDIENIEHYTAYDYAESSYIFMDDSVLLAQIKPAHTFHYGASGEMFKMIEQVDYNVTPLDSAFFVSNLQLCFDYDANPNFYKQMTTPIIWLCNTQNRPYGYSDKETEENMQLRAILLRYFLKQKHININETDSDGNTALHRAIDGHSTMLVKTLSQDKRININQRDGNGNSPLLLLLHHYRYLMSGRDEAAECLRILMSRAHEINFQLCNYEGETVPSLIKYNWPDLKLLKKRDKDLYRLVNDILAQCEK